MAWGCLCRAKASGRSPGHSRGQRGEKGDSDSHTAPVQPPCDAVSPSWTECWEVTRVVKNVDAGERPALSQPLLLSSYGVLDNVIMSSLFQSSQLSSRVIGVSREGLR